MGNEINLQLLMSCSLFSNLLRFPNLPKFQNYNCAIYIVLNLNNKSVDFVVHAFVYKSFGDKLKTFADGDEVLGLEGSTTNQATINILLGENLLGVAGLAATTVENGGALCSLTELLGQDAADVGVNLLGLLGGSGLAGTDSPYGFVGEHDL